MRACGLFRSDAKRYALTDPGALQLGNRRHRLPPHGVFASHVHAPGTAPRAFLNRKDVEKSVAVGAEIWKGERGSSYPCFRFG